MSKNIDLILKDILEEISVGKKDYLEMEKELNSFLKNLNLEIKRKNISAEVFVGGSFAKKTLIKKENYDADVFVRFDKKYKRDELSLILENILKSVKEYTEGRLICLFGCGGNRDAAKRPKMAKAAAEYADMLIITSDNPRNENPDEIIKEIVSGLEGYTIPYDIVTDRRQAVYHALEIAKSGDVIVLAGKGHEDYQILADNVHIHFDEREIVADGLKLLGR